MTARLLVLWDFPTDPDAFDRHYRGVHIPLARRLPKLRGYTFGRETTKNRGNHSYFCVAELEWDTKEDMYHAFASTEGRAVADDVTLLERLADVTSMTYTTENLL
ncbi:EthD family reductase [Nocardia sp. NBC_00881]|uniref:EthD family reductase n=1 Tax=Nocardia sp. NBC_00881 TaxID=2975995 RepID=UPI00386C6EEF|nr:EthD family reductase [Nocardia sp. NBC_00881]